MPSGKTVRALTTALVVAIWMGVALFIGLALLPQAREVRATGRELQQADVLLKELTTAENLPTRGLIKEYATLRAKLEEESGACASFYLFHNAKLDRTILASYELDPNQFAINYAKLKEELARKAGNANFLDPYPWEKPDGKPDKKDFAVIEKRACIAEVLVNVLTVPLSGRPASSILRLSIGEAQAPPNAPPVAEGKFPVARYRVFPMDVQLATRFSNLGLLLNSLVSNPSTPPDLPFMSIRAISISQAQPDTVSVRLWLDLYDFYRVERGT